MAQATLADGLQLEYEVHGSPTDPTIVLIRGLGTQMIEWPDTFIQGLTGRGLCVVAFDNRDVGLSSKCESGYTLSAMAGDVVGLLDSLGIQQAHIFGISLGGMVAQLVAVEHADRVVCLFSVMSGSGNPDVPTVSPEMYPFLTEKADTTEAQIALNTRNRALFGSPGYAESEEERRAQAERAYQRCFCPDGVARQMQAANEDGSRVLRLQTISCPALVIHGADDPLVNVAAGEDTAKNIPQAQLLIVPGMGHNIPAALGETIAAAVDDFIAANG